ncbi:MAG: type II toxin-antitoxin system RelE/ParE family toxin [Spirochaetales bacterium]|nr:type II toxin-antitoxin system RelE/ParE family toxin [Spirochaetales bacterium]
MAYNITFKKSVAKDLKKVEKSEVVRILKKIETELPSKAGQVPELKGQFAGLRRLRVGDYRIIFTILGDSVLILRIQHRKEVYRP